MRIWPINLHILSSIFDIGAGIATSLGLLGFTIAAWLVWSMNRSRQETKRLEMLPLEERATIVDKMLTRYNIDGRNFTRDQKFILIREEMGKRFATNRLSLIVVAVSCVTCFGVATFVAVRESARTDKAAKEDKDREDQRQERKAELRDLTPLLNIMVGELDQKGPLRSQLESYRNEGGKQAWESITELIGTLEKSSTRIDELMRGSETGFQFKQYPVYVKMTEAMREKRSAFSKLKNMRFPLSDDDIKQLHIAADTLDTLQSAIRQAQEEVVKHMNELNNN